ncbi:Pectate lyase A precursor [Vibrio aerogenes CECT 7868]|uniref:Pectate lyase n=1 Tax=Vibrio aerogenes CECT 7868 TaxID=1216006 RepID=A0A1M5WEI0_9VIBR|nr:pectate lyase [Vibrio aerogenes]SHH85633.1 Pectate lyase A precursor [Vibrio aerogenes CECT 7868]
MKLIKTSVKIASLVMAISASVSTAFAADTTLMLTQENGENILTWSTDVNSVARQEVYRSETSSFDDATQLSAIDTDRFVAEDEDASAYKDYWYWVKVYDDTGESHLSNASSTVPQLSDLIETTGSSKCKAGATFKNETVDCGGKTIGLSCDGDDEKQPPVLTLINATVKNVKLSKSGGSDGIHCKSGNCTLQNVVWQDICEDAATLTKTAKSMTIIGGMAYNSKSGPGGKPDKVFQHNAKNGTTITVKGGFTLKGEHGKMWRSCGNCTNNGGPRKLVIDNVKVDAKIGSIAGVNTNFGDVAKIRKLKIKNYDQKKDKPHVCQEFKGVQKKDGESPKLHGGKSQWNSKSCQVSKSDVTKL